MRRASVTWNGKAQEAASPGTSSIDMLVLHIGKLLRHPAYRRETRRKPPAAAPSAVRCRLCLERRGEPCASGSPVPRWTRRASTTSSGTCRPSVCGCAAPPSLIGDPAAAFRPAPGPSARRPPSGLSCRTMSPPWARAMSRAIASPSPEPPASWRASSSRTNGLNTSSRLSAGMPGPSSSIDDEEGPRLASASEIATVSP